MRLLRNRDFMLLWSGGTVSGVGSQISSIGLTLLVLGLTGSSAQAGIVAALDGVPYIFLSLPAGALVDRWDRKLVMIVCDSGRALNLLTIPAALAAGHLSLAQLYVVALVEGTLFVFFNIAETSALRQVVGADRLPDATAQNEASWGIAALTGPTLGGAFYGLSRALPFLADAVSYAASALALVLIRTPFRSAPGPHVQSIVAGLREALEWLWNRPILRFLGLFTASGDFLFSGIPLILIVTAESRLHARPAAIGIIFSIAAVGGIAGSLIAARLQRRVSLRWTLIGTQAAIALLYPLFTVAPNPVALGAVWAVIAVAVALSNTARFSYQLTAVPDAMQGRINGLTTLLAFGSLPIGQALTGASLQVLGSRATILVIFVLLVLLALWTALNRSLREA